MIKKLILGFYLKWILEKIKFQILYILDPKKS